MFKDVKILSTIVQAHHVDYMEHALVEFPDTSATVSQDILVKTVKLKLIFVILIHALMVIVPAF